MGEERERREERGERREERSEEERTEEERIRRRGDEHHRWIECPSTEGVGYLVRQLLLHNDGLNTFL